MQTVLCLSSGEVDMKTSDKKKFLNIVLYAACVLAMIGLMILGSEILAEDNFSLLIEFSLITVVTLLFLYLISGKKDVLLYEE